MLTYKIHCTCFELTLTFYFDFIYRMSISCACNIHVLCDFLAYKESPFQNIYMHNSYIMGGWVGRWCWVASSAKCPATVAYSTARACCACSRYGTGGLLSFYIFYLSSLSNVLPFGRQLNMTKILWFRLLNPNDSCQLQPRASSFSTG